MSFLSTALAVGMLVSSAVAPQSAAQRDWLLPGETVQIVCEDDPTFSGTFPIDFDGIAKLPVIGPILLAGLTEQEAARVVAHALVSKGFLIGSGLRVSRVAAAGTPIRFFGAVDFGGSYPAVPGLRLSQVLAIANPTDSADLEAVAVTDGNGKTFVVKFDPKGQSASTNPELRAGDRVFVPLAKAPNAVAVLGQVKKVGNVSWRAGLTASAAIELAGGVTGNGDVTRVQIEREGRVIDTVNLEMSYDAVLQRGDTVRVPLVPQPKFVFVMGAVTKEGRYDFKKGMTVQDALNLAGGVLPEANLNEARVARRVLGNLKRTKIAVDATLEPGDLVEVPFR